MNNQAPIIVHGRYNSDNVEFTMRAFDGVTLDDYYRMVDGGLITITQLEIPTGYTFMSPIRLDAGVNVNGYDPETGTPDFTTKESVQDSNLRFLGGFTFDVNSLYPARTRLDENDTEPEIGYRISHWCENCGEWHPTSYPFNTTAVSQYTRMLKENGYKYTVHVNSMNRYRWDDVTDSFQ